MNRKGISVVDSDEDVMEVGIGNNGPWSSKNESIYVELMDEYVKNYNSRVTGSFTKEAWQRIRKKLIKLTGYPYTDNQVKNKFNQLRLTHIKFVSLCTQSGCGWCPTKGIVDATEEMWNRLYKINNKAKSFRKCGFPHYAAMTRVLGDNTAKRMNVFASTQSPSATDSSDPDLKKKEEDGIEDLDVDNLKASVKERGKAITPRQLASQGKGIPTQQTLVHLSMSWQKAACLSILNGMDDLDGLSYSKAMTKLKEDPTWRPIFLQMPEKRKIDWCTSLP
ncbi:L10-interacting MYB domain-containing protein [Actinidia chinensis var. chinensis]|uniref:L10-interacting MYB domain-containing protein n=1 Tax=Actinidia chinensis var. chinensis TaxID=1590841 RepID=A0A2R6PH13_ACTCC|nr:L10-interacting MYB domain-containing protein [Actinidia chinensis var. chinensis]